MIQAIKDSKWYWYIPIVGLFFISSIVDWIFEPKVVQDMHYRNLVILYYVVLIHSPAAIFILHYLFIK